MHVLVRHDHKKSDVILVLQGNVKEFKNKVTVLCDIMSEMRRQSLKGE